MIKDRWLRSKVVYLYLLLVIFLSLLRAINGTSISYAHQHAIIPVTRCNQEGVQAAITRATARDMIRFQCNGIIALTSTLVINKDLILDGNGRNVTLDGNNAVQVLTINSGVHFTLNGLTIAHGNASLYGGGLYSDGTVNISSSTFTHNAASSSGGAIFNHGNGTLNIAHSTLISNSASIGGAIASTSRTGMINITTSTFVDNQASNAGAISNSETMTISASTFMNNIATFRAAALDNDNVMNISNSTFFNNNSPSGVIYNLGPGTVNITYSTLANNNGDGAGTFTNFGKMTISASILADKTNCFGPVIDGGYNLEIGTSCGFTASTDLQNTDPKLAASPADNGGLTQTLALQSSSPAINKIPTNVCAVPEDQRGIRRPQGPGCDIGAFEFRVPLMTLPRSPIKVDATSDQGAVVNYTVTASLPDDPASTAIVDCSPASGSPFTSGVNTVTCSASDHATPPSTTSGSFQIVVQNKFLPVLQLPGPITVEATSDQGAPVVYAVSAIDPRHPSGLVTVSCHLPSGSIFPVGVSTVQCSATNAAGGITTGTFQVTVIKPLATAGPSPTATPIPTAELSPIPTEELSPTATLIATPAEPSPTATLIAIAASSPTATPIATAEPSATATLIATAAPSPTAPPTAIAEPSLTATPIVMPMPSPVTTPVLPSLSLHLTGSPMTVDASGPQGAVVFYPVTATDPLYPESQLVILCVPPSGSTFPIGTTTVQCTAANPAGARATGSFQVVIQPVPTPVSPQPTEVNSQPTEVNPVPTEVNPQPTEVQQQHHNACDTCNEGNSEDHSRDNVNNQNNNLNDQGNYTDDQDHHGHHEHGYSSQHGGSSSANSASGYPELPNTGSDPR